MTSDSTSPNWLPQLVCMTDYGGDWNTYVEVLYSYFKQDFVDSKPVYKGRRIGLKRHPMSQGKEATFWHMTSTGSDEESRVPEFRRCERIRWPKPIIEIDDELILTWVSVKKGENRIHLWLRDQNYLVVLAERNGYIIPWTAYETNRSHTRTKLLREYQRYQQKG